MTKGRAVTFIGSCQIGWTESNRRSLHSASLRSGWQSEGLGRLQLDLNDRRVDQRFLRVFSYRNGTWRAVSVAVTPLA
jgi:hypothetical protein